jgi:predicted AAA+ superfamily ATPase
MKIDGHARKVRSHVEILEELFVVSRIEPSSLGVGKSRFFVSDSGFSKTIGTSDLDALRVWFANELYAQFEYAGENKLRLQYFRSKNQSGIDFVLPDYKIALLITDAEICHEYALRAPISFAKNHPDWRVVIASPASSPQKVQDRVRILPWSGLC